MGLVVSNTTGEIIITLFILVVRVLGLLLTLVLVLTVLGIVLIEVEARRACCENRYPLRRANSRRIPAKHDGQPNEVE